MCLSRLTPVLDHCAAPRRGHEHARVGEIGIWSTPHACRSELGCRESPLPTTHRIATRARTEGRRQLSGWIKLVGGDASIDPMLKFLATAE
jgi:hypothetical protein